MADPDDVTDGAHVSRRVLVPSVFGSAVHLHPVLVIVALLIGADTFGLLGAAVTIPLAAAQAAVEHLYVKDVVKAADQ